MAHMLVPVAGRHPLTIDEMNTASDDLGIRPDVTVF